MAAIILRIIPWLTNYPLHRDEALYGYWAQLIASGRDPLLLSPWVDKPPLVLYLLAADIRAFGASELALRLPGLVASLLLVLVTFGFARRAHGVRVALVAAGLLTLSPFAILFSPTAFTDPWLAVWLVAAAWAALARRPLLAGLLLGLAVASKQQGVLGVPLVFALLVAQGGGGEEEERRGEEPPLLRSSAPLLLRSILGLALIFAPVTYWDSLRWVNRPSFWDRSVTTYGPLALAPLAEWPQRAADWATQMGYLFGLPVLSVLMLLIAAAVGVRAILILYAPRRVRPTECPAVSSPQGGNAKRVILSGSTPHIPLQRTSSEESHDREQDSSPKVRHHAPSMVDPLRVTSPIGDTSPVDAPLAIRVDVILALYTAVYLALHFAATFQPWDRYLLPILPWVCVLTARGFVLAWERLGGQSGFQRPLRAVAVLLLAPALLYASWLGAAGRLPVGSDHGAYAGLDQAIATLRKQPADAIIYDRWLGWHYDFYLFDAPQERRWWGSGWKLADDSARTARIEPARAQWVVLPDWEKSAAEDLHLPLASRGLALVEIRRILRPDHTRSFTLYRIAPLRAEVTP